MYGSGVKIVRARTGIFAAARGTTSPGFAGRRTVAGSGPTTSAPTTVSGLSGFQVSRKEKASRRESPDATRQPCKGRSGAAPSPDGASRLGVSRWYMITLHTR